MPLTHSPLSHAPNATSVLQTWLNPISFLKPAPGSPRKGTQSGNPNPMMLQDRQASSGHLPVSEWAKRCVKCLPGQFNFRLEDRFPKEDVVYSHFVDIQIEAQIYKFYICGIQGLCFKPLCWTEQRFKGVLRRSTYVAWRVGEWGQVAAPSSHI